MEPFETIARTLLQSIYTVTIEVDRCGLVPLNLEILRIGTPRFVPPIFHGGMHSICQFDELIDQPFVKASVRTSLTQSDQTSGMKMSI